MTPPAGKPKLALVVKYYRPMPRLSGILRFVIDLVESLEDGYEIRVFTYRYSREIPAFEQCRNHRIARFAAPFPFRAGRAVGRWQPDLIVFGSGFWRAWFLLPYWWIFRLGLGPAPGPVVLAQFTNMTGKLSGLLRFLLPRPAAVIALTEPAREHWERILPGRAAFIPPGMAIPAAGTEFAEPEVPPSAFRIGFFGHLQHHKGPDVLLKVFQELDLPETDLLINGVGEMEEELRAAARGRENITIQGYVPQIDPWLRSCRLLVFPYRSSVSVLGYSRAALDGLAAGIPLIVTPSPALAPLVREGENGYVCRNEDEIKEKIQAIIADPALQEKLSAGARRSAEEFEISRIAARWSELLRKVGDGDR
jgi:glycosyltransferase involved in cell wall biosynthesis